MSLFVGILTGMRKEQYAGWPSPTEVADRLGVSLKTIERAVERGEIQKAYRKMPGRRAAVVLNPDDVDRYSAASVQPEAFMMPADTGEPAPNGHGKALAVRPPVTMAALPAMFEYLQSIARPAPVTLYLDVKAAAEYSGLPISTIRMLIDSDRLPAMKTGRGFRVRRKDLEAL